MKPWIKELKGDRNMSENIPQHTPDRRKIVSESFVLIENPHQRKPLVRIVSESDIYEIADLAAGDDDQWWEEETPLTLRECFGDEHFEIAFPQFAALGPNTPLLRADFFFGDRDYHLGDFSDKKIEAAERCIVHDLHSGGVFSLTEAITIIECGHQAASINRQLRDLAGEIQDMLNVELDAGVQGLDSAAMGAAEQ